MNPKYFIYAMLVTLLSTGLSWSRMLSGTSNDSATSNSRGSGWTTHSGGFGGFSGGGHK